MFYVLSYAFSTHPEFDTLDDAIRFARDVADENIEIYTLDDDGRPNFIDLPR